MLNLLWSECGLGFLHVVHGALLLHDMDYNYSEHKDAQKGPPCSSFGGYWNVHPDSENIQEALLYGNSSLHAHRSCLKAVVPKNMDHISVTEETSHAERLTLKTEASLNMNPIYNRATRIFVCILYERVGISK